MSAVLPKFLVIDDDEAFNNVLCRALARRGYTVNGARSATEALEIARQVQPERIVLDLNLAGWGSNDNGLALIAPLKRICPHCRIILLTGYASIATAIEAIKLGATHYLAKPVDVDTLLTAYATAESEEEDVEKTAKNAGTQPPPNEPLSVNRLEWEHIQRVLLEHDGNISATARALKMHRRTLQRKLGKYPVKE